MSTEEIINLWNKSGDQNMSDALQYAIELAGSDTDNKNILLLLQGDLNRFKHDKLAGILDYESQKKTLAQLSQRLLGVLGELSASPSSSKQSQKEENPNQGKTIVQNADKIYNIDKIDKADFS